MLIAHLSDPHLRPDGMLYQGLVDSNAMFDLALDTLLALTPAPDLVIIGGDLVDEGSEAEYDMVLKALERIEQPVLAIPGNHDNHDNFRRCLAGTLPLTASGPLHFDTGNRWPVRVIGFDVTVPGAHYGEVTPDAAEWLQEKLQACPKLPTMLLMHQPPTECGMHFIDAYRCFGEEHLSELVRQNPQIERILCGHIHRFMQSRFAGNLLMTAPSTATAIALRLEQDAVPASFVEPPAFLLHDWQPGRDIITHWVPVGRFPGPFSFF